MRPRPFPFPKPLFLAALALNAAAPARAMTPPAMAVQVSPGSPLRGLGAASADGLGAYLTVRHSARDVRRRGTEDLPNPDREKNETLQTALFLDYRLGRNLSAGLSIPYVRHEASFLDPVTRQKITQTAEGPGDAAVFGRYSLWKDRLVNPRREWLAILGLELGTGSIKEEDGRGNRLAATLQPGSGTTDLILGTAFVWGLPLLSLHGDVSYKKNGRRAYAFGDAFAVNAGAQAPLGDRFGFLAEVNGEFYGRDLSDLTGAPGRDPDGTVQNTGGETVYFSPALRWSPAGEWALTAGVQWPLHQNFRGTQLKAEVNYTLGLSARFSAAGGNP